MPQFIGQDHSMIASSDPESGAPQILNASVPPGSIAWTPIHPITCCFPFVGHMGITDSRGYLHDWHGCPISANHPKQMLFGEPCRYVRLASFKDDAEKQRWDAAIQHSDDEYARHVHVMVCGHDCHSHVARVLNIVKFGGGALHNKVELACAVFFCGKHVSPGAVLKTWAPFCIFLAAVLLWAYA